MHPSPSQPRQGEIILVNPSLVIVVPQCFKILNSGAYINEKDSTCLQEKCNLLACNKLTLLA